MHDDSDRPAEGLGLLANGSSGRWDVAVDESLDRDEWFLELEGPQTYLYFQLSNPGAVSRALNFLRSGPGRGPAHERHGRPTDEAALSLGWFGSSPVALAWDNEGVPRCFILVGPGARSTLRLSLGSEDIGMLIEALEQVVQDIPEAEGADG